MQKYQDTVLNGPTGRPVSGATVTVTTLAGAPATIYSDNGVTPISTLTTRTDGSFAFYAADGRYTITITGAGLTTKTITDILLEDPADLQVQITANAAALAASGGAALIGTATGSTLATRLLYVTQQSSQPANAWAMLVAPYTTSSTAGYIDNVLTLQNLSKNGSGAAGNAAIRCRDAITGYERAAFGYSGSGDGPTAYYANLAYVEIGNLSPDAQDTDFGVPVTFSAGGTTFPAGKTWMAMRIKSTTGDITFDKPTGLAPTFGVRMDVRVGQLASPQQTQWSGASTYLRIRERDASDQFSITTNVDTGTTKDNTAKTAWRLSMGGGSNFYKISRMAIGSTAWTDLFYIDDNAVHFGTVVRATTAKSTNAPASGSTLNIPQTNEFFIINANVGLATLTINLPSSPVDGQFCSISYKNAVTALTLGSGTNSIANTYTSAAGGDVHRFIYDSASTTWFRV